MKELFFLVLIFLISQIVFAEENSQNFKYLYKNDFLTLYGNYRLRYEFYDNYDILNSNYRTQQSYLLSRLRINLDFNLSKNFVFHTQIQDSEIIDSPVSDKLYKGKNNPYHDPFDMNEFYFEYKYKNFEFIIGRQNLLFGERRIFGPGDWGNTGRYRWDALRVIYSYNFIETNFIAGRYILHDPHIWPDKTYNGVTTLALYNRFKSLPLEIFWIYKADTSGKVKGESEIGNSYTHFAGLRLVGKHKPWNYDLILVKEFGDYAGDMVDAYGLVFILGYKFSNLPWQPWLGIQYVVGSGDKDPKDGKHQTFDGIFSGADTTLYGGWMQIFFWRNLREHRIEAVLKPSKTQTLRFEYHYFTLDEEKDAWYSPSGVWRRDKTGKSGKELGHEINFIWNEKFNKTWDLLLGYSIFFPEEFVKKTGKSNNLSHSFLQILFYF